MGQGRAEAVRHPVFRAHGDSVYAYSFVPSLLDSTLTTLALLGITARLCAIPLVNPGKTFVAQTL